MSYELNYDIPVPEIEPDEYALIAVGDLRDSANVECWPEQAKLERQIKIAFEKYGKAAKLKRAHGIVETPTGSHGFLSSAKMGDNAFSRIHPEATVIVASSAWAYAHHALEGLRNHKGSILLLSNDSGKWPGIVFLLQLRASLTKLGKDYAIGWGNDLSALLAEYFESGTIKHDTSHVKLFSDVKKAYSGYSGDMARGIAAAEFVMKTGLRMGVFDEYCMGMFAAVIEDQLLPPGITKERLSQSTLLAKMLKVSDSVIDRHREWLKKQNMRFVGIPGGNATLVAEGVDEARHLTEQQIRQQLAMYEAAVQIAEEFGCSSVGIQYQQGLKDLCAASDLAEGLLNSSNRPPVFDDNGAELFAGRPVVHFNEVDECCGLDAMLTDIVWRDMGMISDTSLHDVRWSKPYGGNGIETPVDVGIWEISGAVPASWNIGGYAGSIGERQPAVYFAKGGSTLKGVSRPGEIVWSRIYTQENRLHMDIGRGGVVQLPAEETMCRWEETTSQWPISHVVTYGVSRDQFFARHKSNHVNMVYADSPNLANRALLYKAAMAEAMGIQPHVCGDIGMTLDDIQNPESRTGGLEALPYADLLK